MKFVADENVDYPIIEALHTDGHDVWAVIDEAPGIDDDEVLARARNNEAVLLTGDKDFGDLVFRQQKAHHGVLLIRLFGLDLDEKTKLVVNAVDEHKSVLPASFTVVTSTLIRVRS